jgi:hypothetical protein
MAWAAVSHNASVLFIFRPIFVTYFAFSEGLFENISQCDFIYIFLLHKYYAFFHDVYEINAYGAGYVYPSVHIFQLENRRTDFDEVWC